MLFYTNAAGAAVVNIPKSGAGSGATLQPGCRGILIHWITWTDFGALQEANGMSIDRCDKASDAARVNLKFKSAHCQVVFDPPLPCVFSDAVPGTTDVVTVTSLGAAGNSTCCVMAEGF